jgi:hypothetical protein
MSVPRLVLLIINVIGGAAVLGSYILGLKTHAGGANALGGCIFRFCLFYPLQN